MELFPHRGIHWNNLAVAYTIDALITEINRQAGKPLLPPILWNYRIVGRESGTDIDLDRLLNGLFSRVSFAAPEVAFSATVPCRDTPAASIDMALVGSSFLHQVTPVLMTAACVRRLNEYGYLSLTRYGGDPPMYKSDLSATDFDVIRRAEILVVEENENFVGASSYVAELGRLVGANNKLDPQKVPSAD